MIQRYSNPLIVAQYLDNQSKIHVHQGLIVYHLNLAGGWHVVYSILRMKVERLYMLANEW